MLLAEPLAIRARRFRAVFVCGLQEGEFPRAGRVRAVSVRRAPARAGGVLGPAAARPRGRAGPRALPVLRRASRAPPSACSSATAAPTRRATWRCRRRSSPTSPSCWCADWPRAPRAAAAGRRRLGPPARRRPSASSSARWRPRGAGGRRRAGRPERTLGAAALARVRHSRVVSAGALEPYGDCPVRWLVERELPPEQLEPEPEPIARGNLMHDVLERLLAELGGPVTADVAAAARAILERAAGPSRAGAGPARRRAAPSRPGRRAASDRGRPAPLPGARGGGGGGWRPVGLERRFGFDDGGGLAAGARARRGRRAGAGPRRDRPHRRRPRRPRAGARLQERRARPEHGRRARWRADRRLQVALYMLVVRELTRARAGGRLLSAAARRRSARRAACSSRDVELGPAVRADGRDARGARRPSWTTPPSARSRWRQRCAPATLDAVPADLLARRLRDTRRSAAANDPMARSGRRAGELGEPARGPTSSWTRSSGATATCCSTPAPAAARPRCWSSGSCAGDRGRGRRRRRSSRSRSPRRRRPSCATGSGRGCASSARARRRAPPRARSSRRSTASAPGCCAPARWPPGWTPSSWCSTAAD